MAAAGIGALVGDPGLRVRWARLRAPAGEAAAIRAALERADWPTPPGRAWVMIRSIRVSAARPGLARQARDRVDALLREAVPVASTGSDTAEAVYCRDLEELIAALCADLAAGRAAAQWYWRGWSRLFGLPRGRALARLLREAPESLTTVTERLARRDLLASVWGVLEPADADALLQGLAGWLRRSVPGPASARALPSLEMAAPPADLSQRWSKTLRGMGPDDPRRWLAACLCALEWRPLALDSATELAAIARALDAGPRPGGPGESARRLDGDIAPAAGRASAPDTDVVRDGTAPGLAHPRAARSPASGDPVHAFMPGLGLEPDPAGADGRWRASAAAELPPAEGPGRGQTERSSAAAEASREELRLGHVRVDGTRAIRESQPPWDGQGSVAGPHPHAAPTPGRPTGDVTGDPTPGADASRTLASLQATTPAHDPGLPIAHGGVFYLINVLSRPEARALITAHAPAPGDSDGWALLWDLGRRLGLGPDPALAAFFAERLDLGRDHSPWELPAQDLGRVLHDLGLRLYGPEMFGAALLAVPGRLHHTPSHLDIDLPLAAVRVEVRRVALDVDPGWVPWLGRVVAFRYLARWDAPAPEAGR